MRLLITPRRGIFLIICLVLLLGQPGNPVFAAPSATITVNSTGDTTGFDGHCTLREAIGNADGDTTTYADCAAGSGADTITFTPGLGTITLTHALPALNTNMTIIGSSELGSKQTISGNRLYRIFEIYTARVVLENLNLIDGNSSTFGGAIISSATLTVRNCNLQGNSSSDSGGAIYIQGGSLTVINSTFSDNQSLSKSGGAIWSGYPATITNSQFTGNQADADGGALNLIGPNGDYTVSNSLFKENKAYSGGGIGSSAPITITNSTFDGNVSDTLGGGLTYNSSNPALYKALVQGSTFTNNRSSVNGGGILVWTGDLTLINSTIYSNTADSLGSALAINASAYLTATHTTISGNNGSYGVYITSPSHFFLQNSIIANSAGVNCNSSIPINLGGNLQFGGSNNDSCGASIEIGNPRLGELVDNGGITDTMMPGSGSAATDRIAGANGCVVGVTTDQRGVTRPINTLCDIGAVENPLQIFLPIIIR